MGSSRPEILGAYLTERLSVYDCPESCGADFSGPCGVAQSARVGAGGLLVHGGLPENGNLRLGATNATRSEEHTSELQSLRHLVCRLLLEKKKINTYIGEKLEITETASAHYTNSRE